WVNISTFIFAHGAADGPAADAKSRGNVGKTPAPPPLENHLPVAPVPGQFKHAPRRIIGAARQSAVQAGIRNFAALVAPDAELRRQVVKSLNIELMFHNGQHNSTPVLITASLHWHF